jgi:D-3-phosphoglycerate dehydrogenase
MPGIIGSFGSLMGDANINIANFVLGRTEPGGAAVALLELDQPLSDELMAKVRAVPHVLSAKPLQFSVTG